MDINKDITVAVGADHAGFTLKNMVYAHLKEKSIAVDDFGTDSSVSVDYPDVGLRVAENVAAGKHDYGILICGSGIGMSIVANKVTHVRAALCTDEKMAEMSRRHNNANVLTLGSRFLEPEKALLITATFLSTPFDAGRHERRIGKIHSLTGK